MTDHSRLEQENAALRLRLAIMEAALRRIHRAEEDDGIADLQGIADDALSGSDSALREYMLEAVKQGAQAAYDDHNSQDSGMGPREPDPEAIVSRILGTHKGESAQDHTNQENT